MTTTTQVHPTIGESAVRLWTRLPSLYKVLIPALVGLIIVLLPASALINARFFSVTTDNIRAQHQNLLSQIGSAFDDLINTQTVYLATLANSDTIKNCATSGCQSAAQEIFGKELTDKLHEPNTYYIEIGFITPDGKQTARAIRGNGGIVAVPGDSPLFSTDPAPLSHAEANQAYVFPIMRDTRLAVSEAYQAPTLRLAVPVINGSDRVGYISSVLKLDDFFAQNFAASDQYQVLLLDTQKCLLATSDDTRRAELYKTWSGDLTRTCYTDLTLPDWDVSAQQEHDTVLSTRVIHGALTNSNQTWTLVVQQPMASAYAQASTLQTLLTLAHLITIFFVAALIIFADRATRRFMQADRARLVTHARDTRFNPYIVGSVIEDPQRFFGRTGVMAQVIGMGVMGGHDVVISGDRRIGKTTLLRQIARRLREQLIPDPTYRYWPVTLSLQGVPPEMFYSVLMDHILRDVDNHETRTDLHYHKQPATYGVDDFRADVSEILNLPDLDGKQTRLVLCLDNLPFGDESYTNAFRQTFRSLFSDVGTQFHLIATGTHISNRMFDSTVAMIRLGPLEVSETARLIRQPVAQYYTFADDAVNFLIDVSDRLPLEVQRLARITVQLMLDQDAASITLAHAKRALNQAIAEWEPNYRLLWNGGTDRAGKVSEGFSDRQRSILLECLKRDGLLVPDLYTTADSDKPPIFTRLQLDEIAYSDAQANIRLTTLFKTWLARSGHA